MTKTYEFKVDTGSLFRNQEKNQENHPDFTGKIKISDELLEEASSNGGFVQLSAWKRTSQAGKSYLSLGLRKPFEKDAHAKPKKKPVVVDEEEFEESPRKVVSKVKKPVVVGDDDSEF